MTKEKILAAAKDLFEEKGFDYVSVREIASHAGVNVALISYHFGSKEALLAALIEEMSNITHLRLNDINNSDLEPEVKLHQTVEVMVDKVFENKKYYQMIYRELSTLQRPELNQKISKVMKKNRDEVRKIIEDGQHKRKFRKDIDTELTIGTMFGLIYQCTHAGLKLNIDKDEESIKLRVRNHMQEMLTCFLKKK
jgi:TetR/AcrR family fatty acid metabolism transcriptional regulator